MQAQSSRHILLSTVNNNNKSKGNMSYRTELPLVFAVGANWPGLYDVETRNGWYKVDTTTESVRCMTPTDTRDYVDDNECPCYIADDVLDIVSGAILRGEVVL